MHKPELKNTLQCYVKDVHDPRIALRCDRSDAGELHLFDHIMDLGGAGGSNLDMVRVSWGGDNPIQAIMATVCGVTYYLFPGNIPHDHIQAALLRQPEVTE